MANASGNFVLGAKDLASGIIKSATEAMRFGLNETAKVAAKATKDVSLLATVFGPIFSLLRSLTGIFASVFVAANAVVGIFRSLLQIVQSVISLIGTLFTILRTLFEAAVSVFRAVASAIGSLFQTVSSAIGSLAGHVHAHFGSIIKHALGAAGVVSAAFLGVAFAAERAWQPVNDLLNRLTIAGVSGELQQGLRDWANELSRSTTLAASGVLELVEAATRLRIPQEQLRSVSAAAIGLSAALGISASQSLDALAKGLRGNFASLKEYIPALKGAKDATASLTIVTDIAQRGFELAQQKVHTFAGFWAQLKNVLAANAQRLGELIAPGIRLIVDALRPLLGMLESSGRAFATVFNGFAQLIAPILASLVNSFHYLGATITTIIAAIAPAADGAGQGFTRFAETVAAVAAWVDDAMRSLAEAILATFAGIQTIVTEWRTAWEFVKAAFEYYTVAIGDIARTFLLVTLPGLFNEFIDRTKEWLEPLGEAMKTGFWNLFLNLADIAKIGWAYLKNRFVRGVLDLQDSILGTNEITKRTFLDIEAGLLTSTATLGAAWSRSLTEGFKSVDFKSTLGKEVSGLASELRGKMEAIGGQLGQSFTARFDALMTDFRGRIVAGAQANFKGEIGGLKSLGGDADKKNASNGHSLLESRFRIGGDGGITPELQAMRQLVAIAKAESDARKAREAADQGKRDFTGRPVNVRVADI